MSNFSTRILLPFLVTTLMFVVSPTLSLGDIVEVGGDIGEQSNDIRFDFNGGSLTGSIASATADFTGSTAVFTGTDLTLSTGEVFDFTATVTHNSQVTNIAASNGSRLGDDAPNDANGVVDRFGNGDVINIAIDVTSGNVVFDGFVNFGTDLHANNAGVGFNVDGTDFLRGNASVAVNGDSDPRFGVILNNIIATDDVDITFIDPRTPDADGNPTAEGIALRAFALQFSAAPAAVPEPSSALLIGAFAAVGVLRRRK